MAKDTVAEKTTVGAEDRIAHNLAVVAQHFHDEEVDNIEEGLKLYTDDPIWEAPNPGGWIMRACHGKDAVVKNYKELFASMKNMQFQHIRRFATEDRVVDDSILTMEIARDGYFTGVSKGDKIEMRLVHIFEMEDGKISKETVFDMGHVV
jgi:ketosteroid isomerase-like protein